MRNSMPQNAPECPNGELRFDGERLSDKQLAAIDLLAMGQSLTAITTTLSIDRKTLYRWRSDDDFQSALAERRAEIRSIAADRLSGMLGSSLDVVEKRLADRFEPMRFRAATTVLRLAGLHKNPGDRTMK